VQPLKTIEILVDRPVNRLTRPCVFGLPPLEGW
jgi:hypothetical protein